MTLTQARECSQGCGCFTQHGYYIQYKNTHVDGLLFVCEDCFDHKYRTLCQLGDFAESRYLHQHVSHLRQAWSFAWINVMIRALRISLTIGCLILIGAYGMKEKPTICHDFEMMSAQVAQVGHQFVRVIHHGGVHMIEKIMENGFNALSAYMYLFALGSFGLFLLASVVNAMSRRRPFDIEEIRKFFVTSLAYMLVFALLDYFLI